MARSFQKYFVLRARKGLITDGLFMLCRNPNYLGEMMIYGSFAGLPVHMRTGKGLNSRRIDRRQIRIL
jgi:steroid 5-alpha reductase family enzyme